jgi:hypothetical protein
MKMSEEVSVVSDAPEGEAITESVENVAGADQLGEGGKKALDAERKRARELEKQLKELQKFKQEIESANLTEMEKLQNQLKEASEFRSKAERELALKNVAIEKGLPKELVARLRGDTEEELLADADELLTLFAPSQEDYQRVAVEARAPRELTGGSRPDQGPPTEDARAVAAKILKNI